MIPTELDLEAARMVGYSTLVGGSLSVIVGVVLLASARWLWLRGEAAIREKREYDAPGWHVLAGASVAGGMLFTFGGLYALTDPWTWTAINAPQLFLAKQGLGL